jgi:hypothetical protein
VFRVRDLAEGFGRGISSGGGALPVHALYMLGRQAPDRATTGLKTGVTPIPTGLKTGATPIPTGQRHAQTTDPDGLVRWLSEQTRARRARSGTERHTRVL